MTMRVSDEYAFSVRQQRARATKSLFSPPSDHEEYYQSGRGGKYSRGTSSYGREYGGGTVGYAAASRSSSRRYEEYDYEEYRDDYRQDYRQPASSGGSSSRSYYAAVRDHYDRDPYLYDDRDPYASSSSTR